ncbi:hypothetical protein MJA45_17095 [Paenibacillus aurantius]|uniref:Uncharacterized protein n=1 Tax=Paenibacillus aurantius TaxID=2918900 RepID=A0AA96RDQ3_9BACL|nr:hypothetical protein [Paenibacillus aurantius]WNQ09343.1 hypothetical protein MJA45_17095 [Paenibacillus aurantius]
MEQEPTSEPSARLAGAAAGESAFRVPGTLGLQDQALIKEFILLPILLTVLERNRIKIESSTMKLKAAYLEMLDKVMKTVHTDLTAVRRQLRRRGVQVYLETKDEEGIRHLYVYQGYSDRVFLRWVFVEAELRIRFAAYFGYEIH